MKKALSHLIVGISAASLAQPLNAVENEDELIPTSTPPAKKREFKYTFEVMKMQVSMRIAIKPEDCLVKAVRDQILNVAPYLISNIHNPSDATYLLDRVFRTDSLEDKEIIRQALYTAAGLELQQAVPTLKGEEAVVDTPKPLEITEAVEADAQPLEAYMTHEEVVASDIISTDEATTPLPLIEDSTVVKEISGNSIVSIDTPPTIETLDLSTKDLAILEEVTSPQLQTESVANLEFDTPQEAQTTGDKIIEEQSIALGILKIENQPTQIQAPGKSEIPSQIIEFSIDLHLSQAPAYSRSFNSSDPIKHIGKSHKSAPITFGKEPNDLMKKIKIFPSLEAKLPVKSKVKLKPKVETQLRSTATPSIFNHIGIAYLGGLMMVFMSFVKEAFGLRTRIQIAARPRNHYQVIGLSDLPTWTFNLNSTNGNRKSGLKKFQKKS